MDQKPKKKMAWELQYTEPISSGGNYTVTVNKPAGWRFVSKTGSGRRTDPWVLLFATDPDQSDPTDASAILTQRQGGAPERNAYLEVHYASSKLWDRPKVRDGAQ